MRDDLRVLSIARIIPGPILLNGYSAMEFSAMMDELRKADGFDENLGVKIVIEQIGRMK